MPAESMKYLAIAITMLSVIGSAVGEAFVVVHSVDGISRNPEVYSKLRTTMILGCSLVETTAIYALLVAILILFVG